MSCLCLVSSFAPAARPQQSSWLIRIVPRLSNLRPGPISTLRTDAQRKGSKSKGSKGEAHLPDRMVHMVVPILFCLPSRFDFKDLLTVPKNPRSGVVEQDQEPFTEALKDKRTEAPLGIAISRRTSP